MILTQNNYFSSDANWKYMSVSQVKGFIMSENTKGCEARSMAMLKGEYEYPLSVPLLVGSFVDAYFEGSLNEFIAKHPQIYTKRQALRADFKRANQIIHRVSNDELFMDFMSGDKQTIFTAELFGIQWKIKMDSYLKGICITDLKVVRDFYTMGRWRYDMQGGIYQRVTEIRTGEKLPFYLAVATKEKVMNLDIFQIKQDTLNIASEEIREHLPRIIQVKKEIIKPEFCEVCDYCKLHKKAKIRDYMEIIGRYAS